ncbi:class I SAM-dependent methyltransferase [bacterium]|nr:class I SAM-dependent methyltransferase [bacterium]
MTNQNLNISFINGDFNEIQFSNTFDKIVSMWAIMHIIDKEKTLNKI